MTEKRFTIKGSWSKSLNRLTGVICDNNKDMYMTDVVDVLNELHKENEQLKHSIKCLEEDKMELQQYIKKMQGDVE